MTQHLVANDPCFSHLNSPLKPCNITRPNEDKHLYIKGLLYCFAYVSRVCIYVYIYVCIHFFYLISLHACSVILAFAYTYSLHGIMHLP